MLFTNPNLDLCGPFKKCELLTRDCLNTYVPGRLTINADTGRIEALENIADGYVEYSCIKCYNKAGDSIKTDVDWRVEQEYNCA